MCDGLVLFIFFFRFSPFLIYDIISPPSYVMVVVVVAVVRMA